MANPEQHYLGISALLHAALQYPAADRSAFLRNAGASDDVRADVESLLDYDAAASGFLEVPAVIESLAAAPPVLTGRRIGPYAVGPRIGAGGMGEVYRAKDTRLERDIALKVLPATLIGDVERERRLYSEARTLAALSHPNIASIYGLEDSGSIRALVLELIEGETVEALLHPQAHDALPSTRTSGTPIALTRALGIAEQVAGALEAAHERGVVHRDLKPANVMIGPRDDVKILDFGLAKLVAGGGEPAVAADRVHTASSELILGTAPYMSPEQIRGGPTDQRTDVWSFGCVLFELLAARTAFTATSLAETFAAVLEREPDYAALPPDTPAEVRELILRCLEKDADLRLSSAREARLTIATARAALKTADRLPASRGRVRWPWLVMGGTGFCVASMVWLVGASVGTVPSSHIVPLTSLSGHENYVTFSPSGDRIAYSWGSATEAEGVYVQKLGTEEKVLVTTPGGRSLSPAWSPKDETIAFIRQAGGESTVYLVSANGSHERKLTDYRAVALHTCTGGCCLNRVVAWSPDGQWLVLTGAVINGQRGTFAIPVRGGPPKMLAALRPQMTDQVSPAVSPAGDTLAYGACYGEFSCDVEVVDLDRGFNATTRARRVSQGRQALNGITWSHDGRMLLVAQASVWLNEFWLWRVDPFGRREPSRVDVSGVAYYPALSVSGRRLAFSRRTWDVNLWRIDEDGKVAVLPASSTHSDYGIALSPDGKRIAFSSDRAGGQSEIWTAQADGASAVRLTEGTLSAGSPSWSPDGRLLAFDRLGEDGLPRVFVVDPVTFRSRRLTTSNERETLPSWSSDGRAVYFNSPVGGTTQVWKVPLSGGPPRQVTRHGGASAIESPDGTLLYFRRIERSTGESSVFVSRTDGGDERRISSVYEWAYAATDDGLHFVRAVEDAGGVTKYELCVWNVATGAVMRKVLIPGEWLYPNLTAPRDGRFVMVAGVDAANTDLMMVENFR